MGGFLWARAIRAFGALNRDRAISSRFATGLELLLSTKPVFLVATMVSTFTFPKVVSQHGNLFRVQGGGFDLFVHG